MPDFAARDRLIMVGLVMLGLLTVVAGVMTGRTTLQHVLETDARDATISWTKVVDANLSKSGKLDNEILGLKTEVLEPESLKSHAGSAARPEVYALHKTYSGPGLENALLNWINSRREQNSDEYVSRLAGFAILSPSREVLATGGDFDAESLSVAMRNPAAREGLNQAIRTGHMDFSDGFDAGPDQPLAFVPIKSADGSLDRIYAFRIDQTAAANMTDTALTVVSFATSLLIVMGFSVPALVASRRIRERWKAEDQIRFLALHDSLTGLPNRVQLRQTLDRAAGRSRRHETYMAVLCLDLDRFKDINDTLGHPTGDLLLQEVSARLRSNVREVDLVGRLGGDEFAIVAEQLDTPEDVLPLARRVSAALSETYRLDGHEVISSASIGIAIGPHDGTTGDELLKNADLALYRAKQDGRNAFRFFEPSMDAALQKRRRLENELRVAVRKGELRVEYQPQFDLQTGALTGYEALARWRHPVDGDIPPSVFLPLAEETGLIAPIGEWILRTACHYATTWDDGAKLAVNLSPAQFKVQNVVAMVKRVLEETGLDPARLELEITEKLLLQNTESVIAMLEALDRLGVSIAMDDFGTGYSSLSYLTRFPLKKIKIDKSFVESLGDSAEASAIVNSIVGLGKSLHVTITAEGVENASQAEILRQWGCNQVQGFYYGAPEDEVPEHKPVPEPKTSLVA